MSGTNMSELFRLFSFPNPLTDSEDVDIRVAHVHPKNTHPRRLVPRMTVPRTISAMPSPTPAANRGFIGTEYPCQFTGVKGSLMCSDAVRSRARVPTLRRGQGQRGTGGVALAS